MSERVLTVDKVKKRFGGLVALNDASLYVDKGEIVGLIGPNGAGKTTMFNSIAGVFPVTSGTIEYMGKDITHAKAYQRCKMGIGRTFQITKPFGNMTVLENVAIGGLYGTSEKINFLSMKEKERCLAEAEQILKDMQLEHRKDVMASTLNVPERKRLEVCRALATKPELLLLDEVVAGLNPSEVDEMVEMINNIKKKGVTILMIEHVMKAVMAVSDRMYVLSFGSMIAEGSPQEIASNDTVIEAYLGKKRAIKEVK